MEVAFVSHGRFIEYWNFDSGSIFSIIVLIWALIWSPISSGLNYIDENMLAHDARRSG